jgi:hypothetical protein
MRNILCATLLLITTTPALACLNKISPVDARRVIEAQSYQAAETLTYQGEDAICIDGKDLLVHDLIDGELVENSDKKFSKEHSEKLAEEARKAKEEKCKNFSFKGATIAALRQEMNEWKECK